MTDPLFLNLPDVYQAEHLSLPWREPLRAGVITTPPLPVGITEPLRVGPTAPATLGVLVQPGACLVRNLGANDTEAYFRGGMWRCSFEGSSSIALDAAHATLNRIDVVGVEVLDSQFAGASNLARLAVVKGTAAASPTAPALPRNFLALASVYVGAAAVTIAAPSITDLRQVAGTLAPPGYPSPWPGFPAAPTYKNAPGVHLTHAASQAINANTRTLLSFDTPRAEQMQGFTMWQAATPWTLYGAANGLHLFFVSVRWSADGASPGTYRSIDVCRNGSGQPELVVARDVKYPGAAIGTTEPTEHHVSGLVWLDATYPYINVYVKHDAGSVRNVLRTNEVSPVAALMYLGPTLLQ